MELSENIERYLAVLSKLYANEGENELSEIIVNSQTGVHEGFGYETMDGMRYGHDLHMTIPEKIFLNIAKRKNELELQLKNDINKIHHYRNEFIENVFIEMEFIEERDWRKESGKLLLSKRSVLPGATDHIWGDVGYKVFLSHKTEVKKQTTELKKKLKIYGIASFVAHEDINPTKDWQNEIENALLSMDAFVALMTADFHDSDWTDQEVGFALGRGVPNISLKLGKAPYGFIGKFQAVSCSWEMGAKEIVKILIGQDRMLNAFIKAIHNCEKYDDANILSEILPFIKKMSNRQADNLILAFNENGQVRDGYGFNGKSPRNFGGGVLPHLLRLTKKEYKFDRGGKIQEKT